MPSRFQPQPNGSESARRQIGEVGKHERLAEDHPTRTILAGRGHTPRQCTIFRFVMWAGIAQLVFLVLFSYAFFFEGYTGLVITIGAILTLAIMMQLTAKVDWAEAFRKKETPS